MYFDCIPIVRRRRKRYRSTAAAANRTTQASSTCTVTRYNHSHCLFSSLLLYTNPLVTCLLLSPGAIILSLSSLLLYPLICSCTPTHWRLAFSCHQVQSVSLSLLSSYNPFSSLIHLPVHRVVSRRLCEQDSWGDSGRTGQVCVSCMRRADRTKEVCCCFFMCICLCSCLAICVSV